jgi:hypothetical protein
VNPTAYLTRALARPSTLKQLTLPEWDILIRSARSLGLLARLHALLEAEGAIAEIPRPIVPHLVAARAVADHERRVLSWELNRLERALRTFHERVVLLKGAAYAALNLDLSRGRVSSDVDILVSKDAIGLAETALLDHGWCHIKLDDYDQYFYRYWSHELPPLQHRDRGTVVDVHHTILPPTGRLHPDPEKLMAASTSLEGTRFRVLAPPDMVLHSAAHAFQDGDLTRGLRDLVDIDDLLRHFSKDASFWERLWARAEELNLTRPIYYALRYSKIYLHTPVPSEMLAKSQAWKPVWPTMFLMDAVVDKVIVAGSRRNVSFQLSQELLYIRSHWLRMPPWLLAKHLLAKLVRRWREAKQVQLH